jgi:flagellar protein FlaG
MQLDGIGGNTISFTNNTSAANQVVANKERPQQSIRSEGKRPIVEMEPTQEEVIASLEKANKMVDGYDRRFEISVHEKTGNVMVKVINSITDEVIREIPSEKVLDMVAGFMETAGIIVDKRI